ncbi:MAG: bifunctional 4-hydroxy-2-oxoglutarate aldolase/2-dehydro-3-deoxy-phosphogluconate aldolase [Polyangia bacterium]|jgi:2-dehydro-3-deoxyphosphogluconate aldolase/(4S)-4-hydroxy-2-oxoglutarate aldolase
MERDQIRERLEATAIIPIIRTSSTELAARAAHAVVASGIDVVEITMNVPDAVPLLGRLRGEIGSSALLGAGTVLDATTARACIAAGAQFIVAPGFDGEVLEAAHALDRPCIPGALTPTEVIVAWRAGADMVKIFPCSALGGPSYLRQLRGPLPNVKLLVTGGVDLATAADYLAAGAAVLGVGGRALGIDSLESEGPAAMLSRCAQLRNIVITAQTGNHGGS